MDVKIHSAVLHGIHGIPAVVKVSVGGEFSRADRALRPLLRSAVENSGFTMPAGGLGVTASTGDTAHLGLAAAMGILAASGQAIIPEGVSFLGELSLDGSLRGVRGAVGLAEACFDTIVCAEASAPEAAIGAPGRVIGAATLREAVERLRNLAAEPRCLAPHGIVRDDAPCVSDVRGQAEAVAALEHAATTGQGLLLRGAPGAGKTMLARRLPGILPPMTAGETLAVARIHSAAGLLRGMPVNRPFRAPHHSVSDVALVGGGYHCRPGEVTLAHRGVLFLDELPEFRRNALDALFSALEAGEVAVARPGGSARFPARPQLIAAMNPCPCGYRGHPRQVCNCREEAIAAWERRVEPYLQHFPLVVDVPPITVTDLRDAPRGETSEAIQRRVITARKQEEI